MTGTQQAKKFEKAQAKKLVKSNKSIFLHEIAFLAVLKIFPHQKLIFGHFLKWQKKWILVKKKFREIDLFDFTSFLVLAFFKKISGPLCFCQIFPIL